MLKDFLNKKNIIAVVGASRKKDKYGYKIYKAILNAGYKIYPVNPNADEIDGKKCYPSISSVPKKLDVVIMVVPPKITEKIVEEVAKLKIKKVWMQPGSESEKAIEFCRKNKIEVIAKMCFVADGLKENLEKLAFDL
ncbi:MAG: CoA-binding protein [Candidatus Anstonellales archaeon]